MPLNPNEGVKRFEKETNKKLEKYVSANPTWAGVLGLQVISRMCAIGLMPCSMIYGMLKWLHKDLEEMQVSLTLTSLRIVGGKESLDHCETLNPTP